MSNQTPLLPPTRRDERETNRLEFLDTFRGLIMIIMAWDHLGHQFTSKEDLPQKPGFEAWEGPWQEFDNEPRMFLARSVSHICAPGFFLTMGMSMTLFTLNRRQRRGWRWSQIFTHYLVRGCILLLVEYLIDFPHGFPKLVDLLQGREVTEWMGNATLSPGDEGKLMLHSLLGTYEVMTSLGLNMIIAPLILPIFVDNKYEVASGWLLFFTLFLASTLFITSNQDLEQANNADFPHFFARVTTVWQAMGRFALFPGKLWADWQVTIYPIFPWLGITLLGQGIGFDLIKYGEIRNLRAYALVMLLIFALVRAFGGPLNFRGASRGEDTLTRVSAPMHFFLQTKYPPDLCYATITLGVIFALLRLFSQAGIGRALEYITHPVLPCFGRSPLFFYILHFWLIMLLQAALRACGVGTQRGKFDLPYLVFVWALVLSMLYPCCARFLQFKNAPGRENSLWRMF